MCLYRGSLVAAALLMGSSQVVAGLLQAWMLWFLPVTSAWFLFVVLTHRVGFDLTSVCFWLHRVVTRENCWCCGVFTVTFLIKSLLLFFLSQQGNQLQWICQLTTKGKIWLNADAFLLLLWKHTLTNTTTFLLGMRAWMLWFWLNLSGGPEAWSSTQSTWTHSVSRSVRQPVRGQNLRVWR